MDAIFEKLPFYGFILEDGILRVRNKLNESANVNGQKRNRGRVANNISLQLLYNFLWLSQAQIDTNVAKYQSYETKYMKLFNKNMNTADDPLNTFDMNKLDFYYSLIELGYNKIKLSKLLEDTLRQKGWLKE